MTDIEWDIRREGRAWGAAEGQARYALAPERLELIDGKLFWSDDERLRMLGLLLENVGLDQAVRLGDPQRWREAIAALDTPLATATDAEQAGAQARKAFEPGDRVIWWKRLPGGAYVVPVSAMVVAITAKRVKIQADDDGQLVIRHVPPDSLQHQA